MDEGTPHARPVVRARGEGPVALRLRLGKFGLALKSTKTKLVEFGRFAQRHASKRGRNRPGTIYFLGLTLYCKCNRKGNFNHREISAKAQPPVPARADAANTAL